MLYVRIYFIVLYNILSVFTISPNLKSSIFTRLKQIIVNFYLYNVIILKVSTTVN